MMKFNFGALGKKLADKAAKKAALSVIDIADTVLQEIRSELQNPTEEVETMKAPDLPGDVEERRRALRAEFERKSAVESSDGHLV
jgi:hypothetical protein